MRKLILYLAGVFGVMLAAFFATLYIQGGPQIPDGIQGHEAEELAARISEATAQSEWKKLNYIDFIFNETGNRHLLDLRRKLVQVDFRESGNEYRALINLKSGDCISFRNGERLDGGRNKNLCEKALSYHKHEFYLLNPFSDLKENTTLKKVGDQALLVQYPEDSFLIVTDPYFLPTHWKMWARMSPLKGIESTFEKWEKIPGGPLVSLKRRNFLFEIHFEIKAAGKDDIAVYSGGEDPFALLMNSGSR